MAVLVHKLKQHTHRSTQQLGEIIRIFKPETVLRWHRQLVRRKWTYARKHKGGRLKLSSEIENWIVRLAKENPRWGYGKLEGELLKLGLRVSARPFGTCSSGIRSSQRQCATAPSIGQLAPADDPLSRTNSGV